MWSDRHRVVLQQIPQEAWPQSQKHGDKNYTVKFLTARLQVHIVSGQYYVSRTVDGTPLECSPTFRWSLHGGPAEAWDKCKKAAGL